MIALDMVQHVPQVDNNLRRAAELSKTLPSKFKGWDIICEDYKNSFLQGHDFESVHKAVTNLIDLQYKLATAYLQMGVKPRTRYF